MRRRPRPTLGHVAVALLGLAALVLSAACDDGRSGAGSDGPEATTAPSGSDAAPTSPAAPREIDLYAATAAPVDPTGTTRAGELTTSDGEVRTYRVYEPGSLIPGEPVALLVALHGGTGWGAQYQATSGFDAVAEANRFVVVYPDGMGADLDPSRFRTWNGGDCCGPAARRRVDDVAFVDQLIDTVSSERAIDPDRVYAAGHSNGGIMAYRLACELSERIVAVGVQAGALGIEECDPSRPVSLLHLHGGADTNVPLDGGVGSGIAGVAFRPTVDSVEAVAAADGCPTESVVGIDPGNEDVAITSWEPCDAATSVRLVVVAGAGHAWMGDRSAGPAGLTRGDGAYPDLDAGRAIWSFLAGHPRG